MPISELSQSYLVLYGVLTLFWVAAITIFNVINEYDMGWGIDEDDYYSVARGTGIAGLAASAFYLGILILNGLSRLENTGITFNWDIAWVAPTATTLGTLIAPILLLVLSKILRITFTLTGTLAKIMKTALYDWCYALSRIGARKD